MRYCSVASAPDVETGLPPNVEIEFACRQSISSARATTPPIVSPLPRPFANVIASGVTPWAWMPQKCSPVRPQPVCTSSEISRMPRDESSFWNPANSPSGGTLNPPTPWIGSAIRQATSPDVPVSSTSTRSSTHAWT